MYQPYSREVGRGTATAPRNMKNKLLINHKPSNEAILAAKMHGRTMGVSSS